MKVDVIIDTILKHEGGFINDSVDRGGATNFGVTQATLTSWLGRKASVQDVKNLTISTAKQIYLKNYWEKPRINLLPEEIQGVVTDMSVNHGPVRAIRILKSAISEYDDWDLDDTGVIDSDAIEAANGVIADYGWQELNDCVVDVRNEFYQAIVKNNPSQKKFIKGWLRRSESFRTKG